jgi:hypothetical protein
MFIKVNHITQRDVDQFIEARHAYLVDLAVVVPEGNAATMLEKPARTDDAVMLALITGAAYYCNLRDDLRRQHAGKFAEGGRS